MISTLSHPLGSFLGKHPFFGLGFGLGFRTHDSTTPLFPVLVKLVIEVSLREQIMDISIITQNSKDQTLYPYSVDAEPPYLNGFQDFTELQLVLVFHGRQAQCRCSLLMDNLQGFRNEVEERQTLEIQKTRQPDVVQLPFPSVPCPSQCSMEFPFFYIMLGATQPALLDQHHEQ